MLSSQWPLLPSIETLAIEMVRAKQQEEKKCIHNAAISRREKKTNTLTHLHTHTKGKKWLFFQPRSQIISSETKSLCWLIHKVEKKPTNVQVFEKHLQIRAWITLLMLIFNKSGKMKASPYSILLFSSLYLWWDFIRNRQIKN